MSRPNSLVVLFISSTAWAIVAGCCSPLLAAQKLPNIVFILADDLGYGDLGCYGHPYARTPNLDTLAREGTRFLQFYATGVTCCPARTGLMTSKFPATFATYPAVGGFGDRVTITQLLKRAGYRTGHFGKWHIGPETQPGTYGIDVVGIDGAEEEGGKKPRRGEAGRDAHIFDAAIRFIEQNKASPFYLNVWGHIAHHPIDPPAKFVEPFQALRVKDSDFSDYMREKFDLVRKRGGDVDDCMRRFLGDVYSMDQDVGRLLRKLDELGLRDNTIVVFSSDQGAAAPKAEDAPPKKRPGKEVSPERDAQTLNLMGYAGGLRGGKHRDYEGGVRVPFIIRWPGHTPANRVDESSVISGIDWLPTLCSLVGVPIATADFDGEDVSLSWLGRTSHVRTKPLFWKTSAPNSDPTMRVGTWKLHGSNRRRGEVELYELSVDPGERNNIAAKHASTIKQLSNQLAAWVATLPKEYVKEDGNDR